MWYYLVPLCGPILYKQQNRGEPFPGVYQFTLQMEAYMSEFPHEEQNLLHTEKQHIQEKVKLTPPVQEVSFSCGWKLYIKQHSMPPSHILKSGPLVSAIHHYHRLLACPSARGS